MGKLALLLAGVGILANGCVVRWQGLDVVGLEPVGRVRYAYPDNCGSSTADRGAERGGPAERAAPASRQP